MLPGEERRTAWIPLLRQLIVICFAWAFIVQAAAVSPPDFNRDIAPLIAKRCLECHNKRDVKGDVNLTTKVGFTKGTENGRLALELVTKGEMPPKIKGLSQKLPDSEIALLMAWIGSGAAWPGGRVLDLYEPPNAKESSPTYPSHSHPHLRR